MKKKKETKAQTKQRLIRRRERTPIPDFEGMIFDMDNTLIDTRTSYLDTIRWTVEIFLTHGKLPLFVMESKKEKLSLLSHKIINQFKLLGGFNDDWDCCYGILVYLLNLPVKKRTLRALKQAADFEAFSEKVKTRPLGVSRIVKMLGRPSPVKIEQIGRIFQEIYLGKDLFPAIEKKKPLYWRKKGLIRNEKLLFKPAIFERLKKGGLKLGIATGRPKYEALYTLNRFKIAEYFDVITTMDDVRAEERKQGRSLRKPDPWSLIETVRRMKIKGHALYVGDLPDDTLAANRAKLKIKMSSSAFIKLADDANLHLLEVRKQSPDFILEKAADIFKLAFPKKKRASRK